VAAPHLVSAACHRDPGIAALAVDCLRHLVGQLLSRAELSNFTYQVGPLTLHGTPEPQSTHQTILRETPRSHEPLKQAYQCRLALL